jgi:putative ABC transport system permease protein
MTAANGGVAARRAVIRWAVRLFRREWRQQLLVLGLLTFAVGAAMVGATAAYNAVPSPAGDFGTATARLRIPRATPEQVATRVATARQNAGTIEVIAHESVPVPGSVDSLDVRAQDPHGPLGASMLALRTGRYPTATTEVAVTDKAATLLKVKVGSTLALEGGSRTVVGLVENPAKLDDEFVLASPQSLDPPQSVAILLRGTDAQVAGAAGLPRAGGPAFSGGGVISTTDRGVATTVAFRRGNDQKVAAALVLLVAVVVLLLVALVAAAGFVVLAQRRLRQLGMMAAVGASDRHLRLVVMANGLLVGAVAAVVGTVAALLGWLVLAPRLERAANHRIDLFNVPLWVLGAGMLLAVLTAAAAAWWPARAMARVPITQALSSRPPRPPLARRSALAAVVLLAAGFVCLSSAVDVNRDHVSVLLLIPGTLAIAFGVLFVTPLAIRGLAATARRWPVAARLALRDLARHQARSGAALAAISLGVGIAASVVIIATVAQHGATEGNLSDRQLFFRLGTSEPIVPERTPAAIASSRAAVDDVAAAIPGAHVIELDAAIAPNAPGMVANGDSPKASDEVNRPAASLARQVGSHTWRQVATLYVGTPELLRYLGLAGTTVSPDTEVLTSHGGTLVIVGVDREESRQAGPAKLAPAKIQPITTAAFTSSPNSLITPEAVRRNRLAAVPMGWLVASGRHITDADVTKARDAAAANGLTLEARRGQGGLATTRSGATAAGVLLALGILAMTVGLIRGEAAGDLRTLTATGATSNLRRALTATTAGALALIGAVLGIAGAYVALTASYLDRLSRLTSNVPIRQLSVTAVGLPLFAIAAGWLLAGREPPAVARQPLAE